jgi:hypothetical protein
LLLLFIVVLRILLQPFGARRYSEYSSEILLSQLLSWRGKNEEVKNTSNLRR